MNLTKFLKSSEFSKAVLMGIAITVPLIAGIATGYLDLGIAICLGAFWSAPSDVKGSFRNKVYGVLIATGLITFITFIVGYLPISLWYVVPILGVMAFAIGYLAVYGFRASLISFSGLLALVLSFAQTGEGLEVYERALLVASGGIWYVLLITVWHFINPDEHTRELFADTYELTAKLLKVRAQLVDPGSNAGDLQNELLKIQAELIDKHETLRDTIIPRSKHSRNAHIKDQRFFIFVELVEILEMAIANPVNFAKMNAVLVKYPAFIGKFQDLIMGMSTQIKNLGKNTATKKIQQNNAMLDAAFSDLKKAIVALNESSTTKDTDGEIFLIIKNFAAYQKRQFEKIKRLQWLLANKDDAQVEAVERETAQRFLSFQDFSLRLLQKNFNFRSPAFRHALRLALAVMLGYTLGNLLRVQNPYWILLTIIVIIRPSYGLTKNRFKQRIIGTFIGAGIATVFVLLVDNPYVYGAVAVVALVIAFTRLQSNYRTAATFITIAIITIYALIEPDVFGVIQYRIIDTLIGATISLAAVSWLWPFWGYRGVKKQIRNSIVANIEFLNQIAEHYASDRKEIPVIYSLARKNAFTEVANLSNAYQEMAQEPKSKQKNMEEVYEYVVLNHTFLSSLSSLSAYVKNNKTAGIPEVFTTAIPGIHHHLENTMQLLRGKVALQSKTDAVPAKPSLSSEASPNNFQEIYLIGEQLAWMRSLSCKMEELAGKI
jgi:uncharacterized membrane protein (TIGR01666 family)